MAQARPHAEDDADDDLCRDKGGQGVLRSLAEVCLRPGAIASHPGIVAPAAGVRKAPGLPPPGRCRPAGPGASTQVRRWRRAGGTGFQGAGGAKGKLTEAQAAELEEVLAREGFLAKPRPDRTPLQ